MLTVAPRGRLNPYTPLCTPSFSAAVVVGRGEGVKLPDSWQRTATGEPMPDVVDAVRRARDDH